ncbi:hypothetical protein NQZ68_017997 [Dissostichus eleginoides]|nr:hypothetical protein NQZ68_017997 [Dissostichus eleginoides]
MELVAAFAVGFSSLTLRSRSLRVKSEHTKNKVELANENWERGVHLIFSAVRERSCPTAGTVNTEAANEEVGVTIPPRAEQESV